MIKRLCLVVLLLILGVCILPPTRPAAATQAAREELPGETCQAKIYRKAFISNGIRQVRWNQQIYWCYNRTQITYWALTTWEQVFSANWAFRGAYKPVVKSDDYRAVFQTSALFRREKGGPVIYWRPYLQQIINHMGGYRASYRTRIW